MKIWRLSLPLIFLVWLAGCVTPQAGQFFGAIAGAAMDGVIAGVTGTEPSDTFSTLGAQKGWQAGLENQARELGVDLVKLDASWKGPNGEITGQLTKEPDGRVCYWLGNDHLAWDAASQCWYAED